MVFVHRFRQKCLEGKQRDKTKKKGGGKTAPTPPQNPHARVLSRLCAFGHILPSLDDHANGVDADACVDVAHMKLLVWMTAWLLQVIPMILMSPSASSPSTTTSTASSTQAASYHQHQHKHPHQHQHHTRCYHRSQNHLKTPKTPRNYTARHAPLSNYLHFKQRTRVAGTRS